MNIINGTEQYNKSIVLALGFFDCVHVGHLALINETKKMASCMNCESAIYTFCNDPNPFLKKKEQVYTFDDRKIIFDNLHIDNIICDTFSEEFASQSPEEFIESLISRYDISGIVVGKDYTFGKKAEGNAVFLKKYLAERKVKVKIMPFERINSQKISTSHIKKFITDGNVQVANTLLTQPYFMVGEVVHARHRGTIIGYPTANIVESENRTKLGAGIYITKVYIDNRSYLGITNVGPKPTFEEANRSIETYILDFSKDIYGKTIIVEFYKKIRDVMKFPSVPSLCKQMMLDEKEARLFFSI
ncbi:MAG: bifunctional riboflavin kinase/FAD synthetase [Clostridia bacterium]|nr:bifunctional riboflavin kinase/FAD synthetase [Clostridia bacterium]